jgi:Protein of unknown function (DUF2846)
MSKKIIVLIVLFLFVLTGCASVPTTTLDPQTVATEFQPPEDKASLFIYRSESFGGAVPLRVSVNDKILGQDAAKTYFWLKLSPGEYTITSLAEDTSNVTMQLNAGKNYFVWQEIKMGMWSPRSQLHVVDESTGRAAIQDCALISMPAMDIQPLNANSDHKLVSLESKLRELEKMHSSKLITDAEYQKMRSKVLDKN